jgi:hypothetical protein
MKSIIQINANISNAKMNGLYTSGLSTGLSQMYPDTLAVIFLPEITAVSSIVGYI